MKCVYIANTKVNRPEGSIETYEYDEAGRITSQENKNGNEIINHYTYTYTYDEANNIIEKTSTEKESAKNLKSSTMKYDKANRLISYNDQEVRYDDDGNMTYGPLDGEMTEFVYDCRNRLISAGDLSYEYDAENNRIAIIDSKENTRTEYVTNTNTNTSLSQVLTEKEYKLDDDGNIIDRDTDSENLSTTIYIHGLGLIAQENDEGGYLTYHYDHLGSTTAITDETGKVIHTYTYGPYGELLSGDAKNIRFLYNGMYGVSTDSNGLYYMRARYYNVDIKRFISQDILTGSISNSPSLNRYSYVQGNPISLTNPFGLSPDISWRGVGHAILDILGFIPVVGDAFDVVNGLWYLSEGNYLEAASCAISAIPLAGSFVGNGIKWGAKGSKKLMLVGDLVINGSRAIGSGATLARGTYGAVVSGSRIVTDIKEGRDINFWDALQFGLNGATVGISGKGMVTSAGASVDNVKSLNKLRVSKSAVDGSDQLIKMDLQFFASSGNSKGGSDTAKLYHSAGDNVADIIVENGFRTDLPNPQAAFNNNRFGRGVYLADSPATALAERPGGIILEVDAKLGKSLDVTNRGIIDYDMGHAIARGSRKHGYDSIIFNSAQRSGGINTVILDPNNIKGVTK